MGKNRKRKNKPSKPRQIASARAPSDPAEDARKAYDQRRNPALWGANDDALKLEQNRDVGSEAETRTRTRRIQRFDCFALLHSRGALGGRDEALVRLQAVRRLEEDIACRMRVEGRPERVAVDGSGDMEAYSHRAILAAERIEAVLALTGGLSARLLLRLCEASVINGQPVNNWRAAVKDVSGEMHDHGQVALVRAACQNLAEAWASYDSRERRAA